MHIDPIKNPSKYEPPSPDKILPKIKLTKNKILTGIKTDNKNISKSVFKGCTKIKKLITDMIVYPNIRPLTPSIKLNPFINSIRLVDVKISENI
tara:strand:- start:321 stop:602 length:282 start_codon:yes stop_codon:yes gene_type:complete